MLLLTLSLVLSRPLASQQDLPVLRSSSPVITIIDGNHVKEHYWALMPEKNPDIYYVEIPMKPHAVTFRSDNGELSFPVTFGDRVDFVILLDGKTACRTQIRAEFKELHPFSRDESAAGSVDAEIPFTLGDNDKIYVKGSLNGGRLLDFQFDLGCGGNIIKEGSIPFANMEFDGTITLRNSDGVNQVPSSSDNHLVIAGLHWHGLRFDVADNMTRREDGILGNSLFQDKVVQIDYDRGLILVHDAPPSIDSSWSRNDIVLDGVVPYVSGSLTIANERREGWFLFDTGAYTSILYSDTHRPWSKLLSELRKIVWPGGAASGPRLTIGDHAFIDFNYTIRDREENDDQLGLLGNDILKRFNVVLDNQDGLLYLRPNSHAGDPYRNPEHLLARLVLGAGMLVLLASGAIVLRSRSRRAAHLAT